jgi:hypothetical protein
MGILRKILRAILEDDGAPSIYGGLVMGRPSPGHNMQPQSHGAESRDRIPLDARPVRRR